MTVGEVLDEYLTDARLRALCTAPWPYMGLPPSRLSFFTWAAMMSSFLEAGPFYSQGSFQSLVDALVWAIEERGSELIMSNAVQRIVVQDGRVTGVVLESGQVVQSPMVVSNADVTETFESMVGTDRLPRCSR